MFKGFRPWSDVVKDNWRSRGDSTLIVSYPKSGRTWHRAALGFYLAKANGLDEKSALDTRLITRLSGLPVASYTHNGANFLSDISPTHLLNANGIIWRSKDVVLLVREPKAVVVSSYHHMKSRTKRFDGSLSEFVRDPYRGVEKILVAYNRWNDLSKKTNRFLLQTYEGMHADHVGALTTALTFLRVGDIDQSAIHHAIDHTRFDSLKKLETEGFFDHKALNKRADSPGGNKVRQGSVDGYLKELSSEDIAFIDATVARVGNPFADDIARATIDMMKSGKT
jgi:hypothetical protein